MEYKTTEKEYIVVANHPLLAEAAEKLGYKGVALLDYDDVDCECKEYAVEQEKAVVAFLYRKDQDDHEEWYDRDVLRRRKHSIGETPVVKFIFGGELLSFDDVVARIPPVESVEDRIQTEYGDLVKTADYTNRCGNCHSYIMPEDKYCRFCGTERGKGAFLPYQNIIYCVYGPPIKSKYQCSVCGKTWIATALGGDGSRYCPECGAESIQTISRKAVEWGELEDDEEE